MIRRSLGAAGVVVAPGNVDQWRPATITPHGVTCPAGVVHCVCVWGRVEGSNAVERVSRVPPAGGA